MSNSSSNSGDVSELSLLIVKLISVVCPFVVELSISNPKNEVSELSTILKLPYVTSVIKLCGVLSSLSSLFKVTFFSDIDSEVPLSNPSNKLSGNDLLVSLDTSLVTTNIDGIVIISGTVGDSRCWIFVVSLFHTPSSL